MDFLSQTLHQFHQDIGWSERNYYSNLDERSRDLLDVHIPQSLQLGLGKNISRHLKAAYSLNSRSDNSFAYMASSRPLQITDLHLRRNERMPLAQEQDDTDTLVFGRLHQDGRLEGLITRHLKRGWLLVASTLHPWHLSDPRANFQAQLINSQPNFCGEINYNSANHIFGLSGLAVLTKHWSLGSEVFYTAKEQSGGLSLASRFTRFTREDLIHSVTTFILNPVMGHLSSSYTLQTRPDVRVTTRYDFNVYSYHSDVSVGVAFAPQDGKDQVLQGSVSLANGLAFCLSGKIGSSVLYKIGMETSFGPVPVQGFGLSFEFLYTEKRFFGHEKYMSDSENEQDLFAFDDLCITPRPPKKSQHILIEDDEEEDLGSSAAIHSIPDATEDVTVRIKDFVHADNAAGKVGLADFSVLSVIGKGAYGKVFLVQKNDDSRRLFAMKVLKKASIILHLDGRSNSESMNERSILASIEHPFIVKLNYAFQSPARLYLILSYASGGELFSFLAQENIFTDVIARFYISELLLGLGHLHDLGIIYRDLKPENVMLDAEGHILLTDFGLSKVALDAHSVCGTVEFMAPEVLDERTKYSRVVDYWSLGVMLFDMVTGSPPFHGGNRKKIMEAILKKKPFFPKYVTQDTKDLCTKLLKKNPQMRLGKDGVESVKRHPFFGNQSWAKVLARQMPPPFIPALTHPEDTSNFAPDFTTMPMGESMAEDVGGNSMLFRGFSFVGQERGEEEED